MLPIIICEDNDIQREKIKNFIELAIAKWNFDFEISLCTGKVEELLSFLDEQRELKAIYFLDVDLKNEINGIMLAEHIRKKDSSGYIIFITTHSEMSHLTFKYKVEAMDYIIMLSDRLFVSNLDKMNCRENRKKKAGTYDLHKLKFRIA
jgi:two-component system response regulator AgrA